MVGEAYARMLNSSYFVPACGTVAREVVRKHFEFRLAGPPGYAMVRGARSCRVRRHGELCIRRGGGVLDKLAFLFAHPHRLQAITDAGYRLVHSYHTNQQRDQILQWFMLRKTLAPNSKIVQPNPFGELVVVHETVPKASDRPPAPGSLLSLLRAGDEMLWKGEYSTAETLYLKCLNYYRWMPEPQLRLGCAISTKEMQNRRYPGL